MSFSYSVTFDRDLGYYRARFWESGVHDSRAKVPDAFWKEYGLPTPTEPSSKAERLALRWAVAECNAREKKFSRGTITTFAETWEIYKAENPDKISQFLGNSVSR